MWLLYLRYLGTYPALKEWLCIHVEFQGTHKLLDMWALFIHSAHNFIHAKVFPLMWKDQFTPWGFCSKVSTELQYWSGSICTYVLTARKFVLMFGQNMLLKFQCGGSNPVFMVGGKTPQPSAPISTWQPFIYFHCVFIMLSLYRNQFSDPEVSDSASLDILIG